MTATINLPGPHNKYPCTMACRPYCYLQAGKKGINSKIIKEENHHAELQPFTRKDVNKMEKNVAKHVLADVLWVTHEARGQREAKTMYELLLRSYRSRHMEWHEECLQMAWEQYNHWVKNSSAGRPVERQKGRNRSGIRITEPPYPIRLEKRGHSEWEFAWPGEVLNLMDKFDLGCEYLDVGDLKKARQIFNSILKECPYFIDALNHLAAVEWDGGNLAAAENHYSKAYEIGHSVLPGDFRGKLPWGWIDNRPFLRSLHGLALVKLRRGDARAARDLLLRLIKLDPDDRLGARMILDDIKKGTVPWDD